MNKNHELIIITFNIGVITLGTFISSFYKLSAHDVLEYFKYH
jgi:hypothetical protein